MFEQALSFLQSHKTYAACFALGLVLALILTPLVIRLAFRLGMLDQPNERKVHKSPMPLMGGLGIFVAMWIPLALLTGYDNLVTRALASEGWAQLSSIFAAGLSMLILGIVDDRVGLRARWKFAVQIPVAILLVSSGIRFDVLKVPFLGELQLGPFGPALSVLWIVGVTNALNLIDGIDGLAAGVAFFTAAANGILALIHSHVLLAVVMWSLAGASLGFLRYNFSPARIFLGDTGSLFLGMTLAVTAIMASTKGSVATSMMVPVLVLGYPASDTLVAILRRLWTGKPVFVGDKGHIHHRLLAMGYDHRKAAKVLYLICMLFCAVGLSTVVGSDLLTGLGLAVIALVFALGVRRIWVRAPESCRTDSQERAGTIQRILSEIETAPDRDGIFERLRQAGQILGIHAMEIEQSKGPLGEDVHYLWKQDETGKPSLVRAESSNPPQEVEKREYQGTALGWSLRVYMLARSDENDDAGSLMAKAFRTADQRLHALARASKECASEVPSRQESKSTFGVPPISISSQLPKHS